MPSPAGLVIANFGNVKAIAVRIGMLQRLVSNPADLIIALFGNV